MDPVVGDISSLNKSSARWDVKVSDVRRTRFDSVQSVRSSCFILPIGTCHFSIQPKFPNKNWDSTYVLKVMLPCTSILRPIKLRINVIANNGITYQQSVWIRDKESDLEFEINEHWYKKNYFSKLTISCEIGDKSMEDVKSVKVPPNERSVAVGEGEKQEISRSKSIDKLIGDLKDILLSGKDSDVVLKVEGKQFKAHRFMMGTRSPVFSAMFEHEMKEKNSGVVVIEDCDGEAFPDLLHYIYTGTVEKLSSDNAPPLYVAADKYQLLELKEECLEYMKQNVSVDNFCDIMTISLRHHETDLTRIATQFFLENASAIAVTVKWMAFLSKNVVAGNELFLKLAGIKGENTKMYL